MADPNVTIALAPLAQALDPIINAVVSIALGAAATYAAYLYHRWTGREMAAADQATLRQAAKDGAGVIFAQAEAGFSNASIRTSNPIVADACRRIVATVPEVLVATGVTPEMVAHMVTAEVGKLQAQAAPAGVTVVAQQAQTPVPPTSPTARPTL